jgi:hypothetical protein
MRTIDVGRAWLSSLEEIRMVADFAELHQNVEETNFVWPTDGIDVLNVLCEHSTIPLPLQGSHPDVEFGLNLWREIFFNINFHLIVQWGGGESERRKATHSPQHEGFEQGVQLLDGVVFSFVVI